MRYCSCDIFNWDYSFDSFSSQFNVIPIIAFGCGSFLLMNIFNSLFLIYTGFWIPEVIQGFFVSKLILINFSRWSIFIQHRIYSMKEIVCCWVNIFFIRFQNIVPVYIKVIQHKIFVVKIWPVPFINIRFIRKWISKWWWWWIAVVVWLTDKRCLALFPAGTIIRDPHHHESPNMLRAGLEPAQNLSSGLFEWSFAVVITTTPQWEMRQWPVNSGFLNSEEGEVQ